MLWSRNSLGWRRRSLIGFSAASGTKRRQSAQICNNRKFSDAKGKDAYLCSSSSSSESPKRGSPNIGAPLERGGGVELVEHIRKGEALETSGEPASSSSSKPRSFAGEVTAEGAFLASQRHFRGTASTSWSGAATSSVCTSSTASSSTSSTCEVVAEGMGD